MRKMKLRESFKCCLKFIFLSVRTFTSFSNNSRALSMIYVVKAFLTSPLFLFSFIITLFYSSPPPPVKEKEKPSKNQEWNLMLSCFRSFCFPERTYNNIFIALRQAKSSRETTKEKKRSERCHHFKRSLKVYTFLWRRKDGIERRDWRNIVQVCRKNKRLHHRDSKVHFFIELTRRRKFFFLFKRGE